MFVAQLVSNAVAHVASAAATLFDVPVVVAASGGGDAGDLSSAVSTITSIGSSLLAMITGNPILLVLFCLPVVGGVIVLVKKLRS